MTHQFADVIHNVLAMRAEPHARGEQVSQAIMGDPVQILEERDGYARIRCRDEYLGWALRSQLRPCSEKEHFVRQGAGADRLARVATPFADVTAPNGELVTRIVFGTPVLVPDHKPAAGLLITARLPSGVEGTICDAAIQPHNSFVERSSLAAVARTFLGTPYLWGGTTPFGFDCSGLVQRVYAASGVTVPRDAYQQAESPLGRRVADGAQLVAGDLVFFLGKRDTHGRGITHVGMMIDPAQMIHAHGSTGVTIEPLHGENIQAAYTFRGAWRPI